MNFIGYNFGKYNYYDNYYENMPLSITRGRWRGEVSLTYETHAEGPTALGVVTSLTAPLLVFTLVCRSLWRFALVPVVGPGLVPAW